MRVVLRGLLLALLLSACGSFTNTDEINNLETRNAQLQGTADALGTPALTIAALQAAATQNVLLQQQLSQSENQYLAAQGTLTVLELGGSSAGIQNTPFPAAPAGDQPAGVPTAAPTPPVGQTSFTETVTASGRNESDDCPIGITSVFDTAEDTIFVNTRVNYLSSGVTLGARWTVNGTLFYDDVACWVPNQDYYNICAYCSIVPDGPTFEIGAWTVELLLDGQVLAQAQFQVVDAAAGSMVTPGASGAGTLQ